MIKVLSQEIQPNTITELYAFYDMNIHIILHNACKETDKRTVIIDTKGNFFLSGIDCKYVHNIDEFFGELSLVKQLQSFILIVDCITFILDKEDRIDHLKRAFNIFWDLVYENDATIIVVNHYHQMRIRDKIEHMPRLGQFWCNMIDNRICLMWNNDVLAIDDKQL